MKTAPRQLLRGSREPYTSLRCSSRIASGSSSSLGLSWPLSGLSLGFSWVLLGILGALLGLFGLSWGSMVSLGALLGSLRVFLGSLGALLGSLGALLGLSWGEPKRNPSDPQRNPGEPKRNLSEPPGYLLLIMACSIIRTTNYDHVSTRNPVSQYAILSGHSFSCELSSSVIYLLDVLILRQHPMRLCHHRGDLLRRHAFHNGSKLKTRSGPSHSFTYIHVCTWAATGSFET